MAIPDFQTIMLPLLQFTADEKEHSIRETIEHLAQLFALTEEERKQLLPSGAQTTFDNRTRWAASKLHKAALLEATRKGHFRITVRGREVLAKNPARIDVKYLRQFPEFVAFKPVEDEEQIEAALSVAAAEQTPEEVIEVAYARLRRETAEEILRRIMECSPSFFERLVVDVLVKMGYGGSRKDAGQAVGKSGDGGIDGIIKEDRLGLDTIYIQAKRWDGTVGSPEIQKFVGALHGKKARKGVFITTSDFSQSARDYAETIETRVVLINGETLCSLMQDFGVGVSTARTYEIKSLDSDYFSDE